jgi:hypothetical protein
MTRLRSSLFLLAITALLLSGAPVSANPPGLPSGITAPAASPGLDADLCTNPLAGGAPDASLAAQIDPPDFILCTCKFCRQYPAVDCQISPLGFTILCEDYVRSRC